MIARDFCKQMERVDPSVGLAIITKGFRVKWANEVHKGRWPDLEGKVCYSHVNGFTRPCKWCPVLKAGHDRRMHDELVCSPEPMKRKHDELPCSPSPKKRRDIVFSNIVAVPIRGPSGDVEEIVEIVFNTTDREKKDFERRRERYKNFSAFGEVLERLVSEVYVQDYLLFGAVWDRCLGSTRADLFVLEETQDTRRPRVAEVRWLRQGPDFDRVASEFRFSQPEKELTALHGILDTYVKKKTFRDAPLPLLATELASLYGLKLNDASKAIASPLPGVRLTPNRVATSLLPAGKGARCLLVTSTLETGHDLTTDRDLLDAAIYASIANHAMRMRRLVRDTHAVISKANRLLENIKENPGALLFSAHVVTSFGHDLLAVPHRLRENLNAIWSRLPTRSQGETESFRERAMTDIDFVEDLARRALRVGRMHRITERNFKDIDVHLLIEGVLDSFRELLQTQKALAFFRPGMRNGQLLCEPLLLKQVISNLVDNARASLQKTSHRTKELVVKTERTPQDFTIIVEDNGTGIDPAIEDQIWEPFFSTKKRGIGTGLGLFICKKIVKEVHGGTIKAESKHGYGTRMIVRLPVRT